MWDWMDGVGDTPQTVTTIGADEEDEEAAIHISLDGYDAMGIGYMALWGFRAKCGTGWVSGWMDGYPLDCYDYQSTCGAKNQL